MRIKFYFHGFSYLIVSFVFFFFNPNILPTVDLDQDLDRESQEYLEALAQATADLEYCVNLCKSRVMMETCFDISITTTTAASAAAAMQDGHRRV